MNSSQPYSLVTSFLRRGAVLIALCVFGLSGVASAHGPTIEITPEGLEPALLNLFVGTTVHFLNTLERPEGSVIVIESGSLESPLLVRPGDDWHYTFEEEGSFEIHLRDRPTARARIVVVPKR